MQVQRALHLQLAKPWQSQKTVQKTDSKPENQSFLDNSVLEFVDFDFGIFTLGFRLIFNYWIWSFQSTKCVWASEEPLRDTSPRYTVNLASEILWDIQLIHDIQLT